MKLVVPIIGLFAVLQHLALADRKGDVKMVDLAEELARSRQDLANAREETKQIIKHQNEKLQAEDEKIKKDAEKIKKENQRLRKQDAKLQREMAKLRRDNSEIKKTQRQKDQNNTLELQHFLKDSLRQKDFSSELKEMMKTQIEEYLQENKICVTGIIIKSLHGARYTEHYTVKFGHSFARVPSFSASLMGFRSYSFNYNEVWGPVEVQEVTESSATMWLYADSNIRYLRVAWIACL